MNSRRFHRMKVSGTKVALTDGSDRLEGTVRNVSNTGIEVSLDTERSSRTPPSTRFNFPTRTGTTGLPPFSDGRKWTTMET